MRRFGLFVLASLSVGACSAPGEPGERAVVTDLATAANAGDRARLEETFRREFDPAALERFGVDSFTNDWLLDARRYGPLRYHASVAEGEETLHWLKAPASASWLGVKLYEGEDGYRGYGMRRGQAPSDTGLQPPADLGAHLDDYLSTMARHDMFSGSVLLAEAGEIVFQGGYGRLSPQDPEITPRTPLNIASLGKMWTAVAALQLVEQGKLSLDEPIARLIPEFPEAIAREVTVRDLLTHTSGIELDEIDAFNARMLEARTVDDILTAQIAHAEALLDEEGQFQHGGEFDYTNEGINLLGVLIERVSGLSYCDYLQENLFGPAGMTDSHCRYTGHVVEGWQYVDADPLGPRVSNAAALPRAPYPAGAHLSSARDLFAFHQALLSGTVLEAELVQAAMSVQAVEAETPAVTYAYGYGFEVQDRGDLRLIGHAGGMAGVSARYEYAPELDRLNIVLSNYDTAGVIVASHLRELMAAELDARG